MKRLLCLVVLLFSARPSVAQTVSYSLESKSPVSHLYDVEINIEGARATQVDLAMPAWAPGTYVIRDFARNVQEVSAVNRQNRTLVVQKTDKQTWRVSKAEADDVKFRYRVYSIGLTDEMADITPASTFMYLVGNTRLPVTVRFSFESDWKIYTAMEKRGDRYYAPKYDDLATAPVFVGVFKTINFKSSAGVPYTAVFSNPHIQMTELQVEADLEDLANAAVAMFGKAPYAAYTFLVKVQAPPLAVPAAYPNSARLTVGENDFVTVSSYNTFLARSAQALIEAWNGNWIAPQAFKPADYSKEAYSRLLWFTKGVSAYCADLLLLRAGVIQPAEYFPVLSAEIDALQHQPGRLLMSLEEASWNVWAPSENTSAGITPTLKGKIAGLLLDAELRGKSNGSASLEGVLKRLAASGQPHTIADGNLASEIQAISNVDVRPFFEAVVRGKAEIDYNRFLEQVGLRASVQKNPPAPTFGIEFEKTPEGQARVRRVLPGSPAEGAKLDTADLILALDGERVIYDNLVGRIHSRKVGRPTVVTILRGERLLQLSLIPSLSQTEVWSLAEASNTTIDRARLRDALFAANR